MKKNSELYDFTQTLQGVIYQAGMKHYAQTKPDDQKSPQLDYPPIMNIRQGYAESVGWMMVQLYEFHPEPLTVEKFRVRAVYSAPRLSQALLELIASEGWANRDGEAYTLTDTGLNFIQSLLNRRSETFQNFYPLTKDKLTQILEYSNRIFDYAIDKNSEQATWCLRHSQNRKPINGSEIGQLIHVSSDYNAWRDDCHMQAYTAQHVDGMTWEAFTFVDKEQTQTAGTLFDALGYRGWTVNEWQHALDRLCQLGWITRLGETYISTELGKTIRKSIEEQTDALFFSSWARLSEEEQANYINLLIELQDACNRILSDDSVDQS